MRRWMMPWLRSEEITCSLLAPKGELGRCDTMFRSRQALCMELFLRALYSMLMS